MPDYRRNRVVIREFRFRFDKALQAAAYLVKLAGKQEYYLRLLKMLYIADREYLMTYGEMITGDTVVAMEHGPVLSNVLSLIKGKRRFSDKWARHLQTMPKSHQVRLIKDPGTDSLCRASESILSNVYSKYEHLNRFQLRDLTHDFAEWSQFYEEGTSAVIPWASILKLNGKDSMIKAGLHHIELDNYQYALLGK